MAHATQVGCNLKVSSTDLSLRRIGLLKTDLPGAAPDGAKSDICDCLNELQAIQRCSAICRVWPWTMTYQKFLLHVS